jgi:hypothetical protein
MKTLLGCSEGTKYLLENPLLWQIGECLEELDPVKCKYYFQDAQYIDACQFDDRTGFFQTTYDENSDWILFHHPWRAMPV